MASVFDEFKDKLLSRIREQFGSGGKVDDLRIELDTAFLGVIGEQWRKIDLLLLYHEMVLL